MKQSKEYNSTPPMKKIDLHSLLIFIRNNPSPVQETTLLKQFFPHCEANVGSLDFFYCHFNLYHYLYQLAQLVNQDSREFMYIRLASCYLIDRPPASACSYFSEDSLSFCNSPAANTGFCILHEQMEEKKRLNQLPDFQGISSYYLNRENYALMDQEELDRITTGIQRWMASPEEIENSLRTLELPHVVSMNRLKQRFRYLARKFHPDKSNQSDQFYPILMAYETLKKWKETTEADKIP